MTGPSTLIVFRSAGRPYALPVGCVREVARMAPLRRLPAAPPWVAGLMELRGELLTVLALPGASGPATTATAVVVVETGDDLVGLAADASPDIRTVSAEDLLAPPAASAVPANAVLNLGPDLPLLLDPGRLAPAEEDPSHA